MGFFQKYKWWIIVGVPVLFIFYVIGEINAGFQAEKVRIEAENAALTPEPTPTPQETPSFEERFQAEKEKREANQSQNKEIPSNVVAACRLEAKTFLKKPDTVKHEGYKEPMSLENGVWTYKAWIQGDNDLGGSVRGNYLCTYNENEGNEVTVVFE